MENSDNYESLDVEVTKKKKSKKGLFFFLFLIIFALGVCAGIFGPKLYDKYIKKDNTSQKENNETSKEDETDSKEDKEEKVENTFDEKAIDLSGYNEFKKDTLELELNGKKYSLVSTYYVKDKDIAKTVYFNDVKIVQDYLLLADANKNYIEKYVNQDIDFTKKSVGKLKDSKSNEEYLIYHNDDYLFMVEEEEPSEVMPYNYSYVSVVKSDGKVLFNRSTGWVLRTEAILIKDKKDVLDRSYYYEKCDPEIDYEDLICDAYIVYNGNENYTELEELMGFDVEFMSDHFYSFKYMDGDNQYVYDYKYEIENGELKETLLNKYEIKKHLLTAGAE